MIKHIVEVTLNNVSSEEQQELKDYLEDHCWGWEEKNVDCPDYPENKAREMKMTNIYSKEEAINKAIEWQRWSSEQSLSYGELAEWSEYFRKLAETFDLVEEFKENCII